jgi:hypothetical protein
VSSEDVESQLLAWVSEAMELRHGEAEDPDGRVGLPPFELGQDAAVSMIQRVRQRLDRVEELQSLARQALGRVMRLREQADFEASLKYDEAMANGKDRYREFTAADEKRADATLASLKERREAHKLKRVESQAKETLDVVGQCYWGLANLREDIHKMLSLQRSITSEEVQT